jgi:hypothetical protein
MCTVTAIPRAGLAAPGWSSDPLLLRLVCSRDERITRPGALAPVLHTIEGRRVVMPTDPESGGTWIAVNECGLTFCLLNAGAADQACCEGLSRGGVIPRLAGAGSMSEALARMLDAGAERYRPFRLLMLDAAQLVECWVEEGRLRHRRAYLHGPVMRTSSSLGDAAVEGPRRTLFRRFFRNAAQPAAAQDAFHDHQWPGREHVSVRMARTDARTVSRTTVEVSAGFVTMIYSADAPRVHARVVLPIAAPAALARTRCS